MPSQLLLPIADPGERAASGSNCRVYERHACGIPAPCQPVSSLGKDDLKWTATLENISQGGVCLKLARRFEPGTGLAIELPDTDTHDSYVVLAKVIHVHRQENGCWYLGCKFISDLSEDELQRLLRAHPGAGDAPLLAEGTPHSGTEPGTRLIPTEERPRVKQRISRVHFQLEIALGTTLNCVIQQVSATNRWPLASGALAMLNPSVGDGQPWKLKVRVRHCLARGEDWDLACTLVKASTPELLRALSGLLLTN